MKSGQLISVMLYLEQTGYFLSVLMSCCLKSICFLAVSLFSAQVGTKFISAHIPNVSLRKQLDLFKFFLSSLFKLHKNSMLPLWFLRL